MPESADARPRVLVLVGTRPEVIKMAPVVRALRADGRIETVTALTGQHTDLVDQALSAFSLELDHDLEARVDLALMRPGQDLYHLAHGLLDGLRDVVRELRPDVVLVEGDTATVFFGALVAFLEKVALGHVEAGLRSGEKWSPFPEEMFRRMTDVLSDFHFAPTRYAAETLRGEGLPPDTVHVTGNTVVDAVLAAAEAQESRGFRSSELRAVVEGERELVLLTAHRRESFGAPLREVFEAVRGLAEAAPGIEVVFPVHPNPNVVGPAVEILSDHPRIHRVEPLDYLDLVGALRVARLVLTDSGGIQEEAPAFGTPVLVLREVTERPEGVEAGVARLVGTSRERILAEALEILEVGESAASGGGREAGEPREAGEAGKGGGAARVTGWSNPYGDGRAGERIADIVASRLTGTPRRIGDWEGV